MVMVEMLMSAYLCLSLGVVVDHLSETVRVFIDCRDCYKTCKWQKAQGNIANATTDLSEFL